MQWKRSRLEFAGFEKFAEVPEHLRSEPKRGLVHCFDVVEAVLAFFIYSFDELGFIESDHVGYLSCDLR